jgi:hypothetical protein
MISRLMALRHLQARRGAISRDMAPLDRARKLIRNKATKADMAPAAQDRKDHKGKETTSRVMAIRHRARKVIPNKAASRDMPLLRVNEDRAKTCSKHHRHLLCRQAP